ncbi:hypothetical protein ABNavy71_009 [Acinetobacter phage AB-Navy71]|nr:hypothetical protein ABNavy71_009 [Acinetobacter phage AB-Navy71]
MKGFEKNVYYRLINAAGLRMEDIDSTLHYEPLANWINDEGGVMKVLDVSEAGNALTIRVGQTTEPYYIHSSCLKYFVPLEPVAVESAIIPPVKPAKSEVVDNIIQFPRKGTLMIGDPPTSWDHLRPHIANEKNHAIKATQPHDYNLPLPTYSATIGMHPRICA